MGVELIKDRLKVLLRESDDRWFNQHGYGKHDYQSHLDHTADYLAKHYNRRRK